MWKLALKLTEDDELAAAFSISLQTRWSNAFKSFRVRSRIENLLALWCGVESPSKCDKTPARVGITSPGRSASFSSRVPVHCFPAADLTKALPYRCWSCSLWAVFRLLAVVLCSHLYVQFFVLSASKLRVVPWYAFGFTRLPVVHVLDGFAVNHLS